MIGYDAGARLNLNDSSNGPFSEFGANYGKPPEIFQDATALMSAVPKMALNDTGNGAQSDAVITATADMTARMQASIGGSEGLDLGEILLEKRSSDVQTAPTDYHINGSGGLFYMTDAPSPDHNSRMMTDDSLTASDATGVAVLPSRSMEIGSDVRDEYGDSQAFDRVGSAYGIDSIHRSVENLPNTDDRRSDGLADIDQLDKIDDFYTKFIAVDTLNNDDNIHPIGPMRNSANIFGETATERATVLGNLSGAYGYGTDQGTFESKDEIPGDRIDDALGELFGKGVARTEAPDGYVPGDIESTIMANPGVRLDELAGIGVPGRHIWDAKTVESASSQLPKEDDIFDREAMRSPTDFSAFASPNRMSSDYGTPGIAGLWDMVRNAERFLPKQGFAGRGGETETAAEAIEGAEIGLKTLPAKPMASVDDFKQQVTNMPAEHTTFGGRSGPSGHKSDPIYTVAIGLAAGTLMPTVPTSGTRTRSAPIPGQRTLP